MSTTLCPGLEAAPSCHAEPLVFHEVLGRFQEEGVPGICDTGRYRCRYYAWGTGPPLVFIPGLMDDSLSFVLPIARLSEHFRCIAYDLPIGRDDGARLRRYRHADLVEDLFGLMDHLELRDCTLFGSSFGATIALAALHARPARFPGAILQGGFARRPLAWAEVALARCAVSWPWPMHRLPFRLKLVGLSHQVAFANREQAVWDYFLERNGAAPMQAVARRALILHQLDLRPILSDIAHPIMLVVGEQDPLVGRDCEEVLARGLPNCIRAEIQGCGHLPMFSHPEVLAEIVTRFLV
jgi:pimeloyl-ACP methyl ester carboxylesterase